MEVDVVYSTESRVCTIKLFSTNPTYKFVFLDKIAQHGTRREKIDNVSHKHKAFRSVYDAKVILFFYFAFLNRFIIDKFFFFYYTFQITHIFNYLYVLLNVFFFYRDTNQH